MNENQAMSIWRAIEASSEEDAREDFVRIADRYAQIRVEWALASREHRAEIDEHRTAIHNSLIDACNILSRRMRAAGEDNSWRGRLGDDRREIGDFACWLHCFLGLSAR